MTPPTPAIEIRGLVKKYGDFAAVKGLDLEIARGEIFTFLGHNGAGKTTTIKVLTGLLRPSAGSVRILGHDVQQEPIEAKRRIGYIPDHPYLYEKLTARDFIHFVADLFDVPRPEAERRMDHYFELFGLSHAEDDLIENFSHGMRQKLVFTASLVHQPELLVVDEPMVGLDPQSGRTLKRLLKRKAADEGLAIFLSTHTLSVAEELADRIGVIDHGELLFLGSLEEMHARVGRPGTLEEMFLELTGADEDKATPSRL